MAYRAGHGGSRRGGRGGHGGPPNRRLELCRFIQNNMKCPFNDRCWYIHDTSATADRTASSAAPHRSLAGSVAPATAADAPNSQQHTIRTWRFLTSENSRPPVNQPLAVPARKRFFQQGSELVIADAEAMQVVIQALASDGGSSRILQLIKEDFMNHPVGDQEELYKSTVLPFLRTIGYPKVLNSGILENFVGTIYNTLFGAGGQYGSNLFRFIASISNTLSLEQLEPAMAVFSKMIDLNGQAHNNDDFKQIAEVFSAALDSDMDDTDGYAAANCRKWLQRGKKRLGMGEPTVAVDPATARPRKPKVRFELKQDMPGNLSEKGPRHDNDFADIRSIRILPTFQEVIAERSPYLPQLDPTLLHLRGLEGLLDRHFRLLREEVVGPVRDAVKFELDRLANPKAKKSDRGERTFTYTNVEIEDIRCDQWAGLGVIISIDQPKSLLKPGVGVKNREKFWERRLQHDALVCLVDPIGHIVLFCTVIEFRKEEKRTNFRDEDDDGIGSEVNRVPNRDLLNGPQRAYFTIAATEDTEVPHLIEMFLRSNIGRNLILLEFPNVLLQAFQPTLASLQSMIESADLPFESFLAPPIDNLIGNVDVPPPTYTEQRGFRWDLSCLLTGGENLLLSPKEPFDIDKLVKASTLDDKQAEALVNALLRAFSFTQGPPGTGKSYTGVSITKVLMANKTAGGLGPILLTCYTNHALDQILEHYDDCGIRKIIRIGSRSKSERLEDLNLKVISKRMVRTRVEKREQWARLKALGDAVDHVNQCVAALLPAQNTSTLKDYLELNYPDHYAQFFGLDEDGFEMVAYSPDFTFGVWLNGPSQTLNALADRTIEFLLNNDINVWELSNSERRRLHDFWVDEQTECAKAQFAQAFKEYRASKNNHDNARREINQRCLEGANIIGVTTSGLARNLDLLRRLPTKVLLVEEAGEVLESHILTALLPSVEHAIFIGDHCQLRPQVGNFELSSENRQGKQYSLDLSLFERMVAPPEGIPSIKLPFSTLNIQRRMHPSISSLVRQTLYPGLEDAPNVVGYPSVVGLKRRLFWLDHNSPEAGENDDDLVSTSKMNEYEVEMTALLVAHVLAQGVYQTKDVAVITPYLGQLKRLRLRLSWQYEIVLDERDVQALEREEPEGPQEPKDLEEPDTATAPATKNAPKKPAAKTSLLNSLKVATVDNFQGNEAKVVIISLVRCNKFNKCGFLKTSNRINVLLSRAQHGMYIIGNARTSGGVPMWAQVIDLLKRNDNFGTSLELCCPRHMNTPILVKDPDDFQRYSPEGGCELRCDRRLRCGHACVLKCHSDMKHDNVRCLENCMRPKTGCDHPCDKFCGDECDKLCKVVLADINFVPPCGHALKDMHCWQYQARDSLKCSVLVRKIKEKCKHEMEVQCHVDVNIESFQCKAPCGGDLECGHTCKQPCYSCFPADNVKHTKCSQVCDRQYTTCSHSCRELCHEGTPCGLCTRSCEVQCSHSRCDRKCGDPCVPCAHENCSSSCPHGQCSLPCAVPCDWIPCSKRCEEKLSCSHQCPSLCGERCPSKKFCQICAKEEIKTSVVDYLEFQTFEEIDLNVDPVLIPRCGHMTTVSNLDSNLSMASVYEMDPDGKITGIKKSEPFNNELKDLPGCPICRGSLRDINRYGRLVRRVLLDESTKRFVAWAYCSFGPLTESLHSAQERLNEEQQPPRRIDLPLLLDFTGNRDDIYDMLRKATNNWARYTLMKTARDMINQFFIKAQTESTPFAQIWNLVEAARRRAGPEHNAMELHNSVSNVTFHIMSLALLIRTDVTLLADVLNQLQKLGRGPLRMEFKVDLSKAREDCIWLVNAATDAKDYERAVEGHIFCARYCALERTFCSPVLAETLKVDGEQHITLAHQLCKTHGDNLDSLVSEVKAVEHAINDGKFTQIVTSQERREILVAMSTEFRGTGHWYTCVNGHPFTIGECGMAMEEASCPQCGETVGGRDHRAVEGVSRAEDLERELADMTLGRR